MRPDAMILVFWMLSFKPTFSLSSYTFIKRLFSSSSLSAIRVVSSAYLRLLIFFMAILIPVCTSSSPAFFMMHSAYKLNKQGDNIQPLMYSLLTNSILTLSNSFNKNWKILINRMDYHIHKVNSYQLSFHHLQGCDFAV